MKAKELRIGNWVNLKYPISEENRKVVVGLISSGIINTVKDEHYEPIPLTEEWLLRFGFIYNTPLEEFVLPVSDIGFSVEVFDSSIEVSIENVVIQNINSVHQLQNLYLALTGEELTIKKNQTN